MTEDDVIVAHEGLAIEQTEQSDFKEGHRRLLGLMSRLMEMCREEPGEEVDNQFKAGRRSVLWTIERLIVGSGNNPDKPVWWRGSVTDLVADLDPLLTLDQMQELSGELAAAWRKRRWAADRSQEPKAKTVEPIAPTEGEAAEELMREKRDATADEALTKLGYCGCGEPDAVLERLLELLEEFSRPHDQRRLYTVESGWQWYLPLYVLDAAHLIEHGGTVGGGWITDRGREFLDRYGAPFGRGKGENVS